MLDVFSLLYIIILLAIGHFILYLRRKADGSKSLYKIILVFLGIILSAYTISGLKIIPLDGDVLKNLSILLVVILSFELSMRLTPDNITLKPRKLWLFFAMLVVNCVVITIISMMLLNIALLAAILFSLMISAIEYFFIDELRQEGDFANPVLLLLMFILIYYYSLNNYAVANIEALVLYILIGIAVGIIAGIILLNSIKTKTITWVHELGLLSLALIVYVATNLLGGSGILSVIILGAFFANSFTKKRSEMKTFSPFIFKSLEILIFLLLGFMISFNITWEIVWKAAVILAAYYIIRLAIIMSTHRHYSINNQLLLTLAPKGIVYAAVILMVASYGLVSNHLMNVMLMVMIFSLIISSIMEYVEDQKIHRLDRLFEVLKSIRYGRKRDIHKKRFDIAGVLRKKN